MSGPGEVPPLFGGGEHGLGQRADAGEHGRRAEVIEIPIAAAAAHALDGVRRAGWHNHHIAGSERDYSGVYNEDSLAAMAVGNFDLVLVVVEMGDVAVGLAVTAADYCQGGG